MSTAYIPQAYPLWLVRVNKVADLAETAAERQDIATEPFDPQEWCDDPERVVGWRVDADGHTDPVTQFGVIKVGTVRAMHEDLAEVQRLAADIARRSHRNLRASLALAGPTPGVKH